jgi:hypothetical protein
MDAAEINTGIINPTPYHPEQIKSSFVFSVSIGF